MKENITELWFSWFYKSWEKYAPGDLIENGLSPSQVAERFVDENHNQFMKLSESELHILKYFLKLIKLKNS